MRLFFYTAIFFSLLISCSSQQKLKTVKIKLEVFDIATNELLLLNEYKNSDSLTKNKVLIDSIYTPNTTLWNGYLGDDKDFLKWINEKGTEQLENWNKKSKIIDSKFLTKNLKSTAIEMSEFTGHFAKGKWYIFYGPSWTDLGGFPDGTMLIDLANDSNVNSERIIKLFPHEINHQIYSNAVKPYENIVLNRILDEGFATYVSFIFHKNKYSVAQELSYTEVEYQFCKQNEKELLQLLKGNYCKNDDKLSRQFANRVFKFKETYPGAIGYYLGFRIVEEFVKQNGRNSWKQIYTMQPKEVIRRSKILD